MHDLTPGLKQPRAGIGQRLRRNNTTDVKLQDYSVLAVAGDL